MKHNWKFAYITPQGGLSGGDDCYLCLNCGDQTILPNHHKDDECSGKPIDKDAEKDIATWHRLNSKKEIELVLTAKDILIENLKLVEESNNGVH